MASSRGIPTVLVETHSLKPYRQRVLGTYVLIEESLRLVGAEGIAGSRRAIAADRAARPTTDSADLEAARQTAVHDPRFQGHRSRNLPLAGVGRRRNPLARAAD